MIPFVYGRSVYDIIGSNSGVLAALRRSGSGGAWFRGRRHAFSGTSLSSGTNVCPGLERAVWVLGVGGCNEASRDLV